MRGNPSPGRTPSNLRGSRRRAPEEPASQFIRRLEALTRTLLSRQYESAHTLWQFQVDLLHLQREIQAAIKSKMGAGRAATPDDLRVIEELRHIRGLSRRLGDSFAWLLLGLEPKRIYPLSFNSRVPIAQEDTHSRAVLAILGHLAGTGMGFPLIHDVTDCLRIGDVTFLRPDSDAGTITPTTVELKTRLRAGTPAKDGVIETFDVTMMSPREFHLPPVADAPDSPAGADPPGTERESTQLPQRVRQGSSPRVHRQLDRMTVALDRQDAAEGLHFFGDEPSISMSVRSEAGSHWPVVRRVIRNARRAGYAGEAVEQTLFISAFYAPQGIVPETIQRPDFTASLVDSGFLAPEFGAENGIVIHSVPERDSASAQLYLPFYLYPIPKRAVLELIAGHLLVIVLLNPGGLALHLRNAGFEVALSAGEGSHWGGLDISTIFTDNEGRAFRAELHNLGMHIREMIYEFKSVKYVVDVAKAMRDSLHIAVSDPVRQHYAKRRQRTGSRTGRRS